MRNLIKSALCTLQDQIHLKYVGRLGPANSWPTYCVRSWLQSSHQESLRLQLFHVTGAQTSSYHKLIRFCYLKYCLRMYASLYFRSQANFLIHTAAVLEPLRILLHVDMNFIVFSVNVIYPYLTSALYSTYLWGLGLGRRIGRTTRCKRWLLCLH